MYELSTKTNHIVVYGRIRPSRLKRIFLWIARKPFPSGPITVTIPEGMDEGFTVENRSMEQVIIKLPPRQSTVTLPSARR